MGQKRQTIAEGIYQDAHGISVIARLGSGARMLKAKPVRFSLVDDDGVPYSKKNCAELVRCRLQLMEDLRRQRRESGGDAGSVGAAIDKWKIAFPLLDDDARASKERKRKRRDDHDLIAHWRASSVAAIAVDDLKRSQVRAQLTAWQEEGRAGSTLNHRKRALTDVLRWIQGADDDNDVRVATEGIEHFKSAEAAPRGIPMPILVRILAACSDRGRPVKGEKRSTISETKIRLRVMAWTGLAQMSVERLDRNRINFRDGKLFFPPRQKGAGAAGLWVDLLPPAVDALRDFDRAGLWGKDFSRSSMWKTWQRAVKNVRQALTAEAERTGDTAMLDQFLVAVPDNSYPYDNRHSFLSDAYEQSGDIESVRNLAQHASVKTTERYTKRAVPARVANTIDRMRAKWFPNEPKPAGVVRDFHVVNK